MNKFNFWYYWLLVVSVVSTLIGLTIAIFPNSLIFELHTNAIKEIFFQGSFPRGTNEMRSFLYGPIGGTISGYFVLQIFIVWNSFYKKEGWAWYAVLSGLLGWFIIDSSISIYHAAYFNVWMINLPTLLINGLPLIMTYSYFKL